MRLVICVHGYPPEHWGGTELATRQLAAGLARRGHEVIVIAGSTTGALAGEVAVRETSEFVEGAAHPLRVVRLTRPDLYFDHWHKSKSSRVARTFRELLERERPDLVHVQHWLRLSRDLVLVAAQCGIPAVCSLHDSWVSCPLVLRIETKTRAACERQLGAMNCIACAGRAAPRTPWVPLEAGFLGLAQRGFDVAAELSLARARLVPTRAFGERQLRLAQESGLVFDFEVVPPCAPPEFAARANALPAPSRTQPLRLGSWGQLSEIKGTDLLFEALNGLHAPVAVELVLAGRETQPGYIDSLRARFPAVRVHFEGGFDARELDRHPVAAVHALVSASRAPESFGLVLEEARALGLPALLSTVGAFAERGGEHVGAALFDAGSAASLRAWLVRLIEQPELLSRLRHSVPKPVTEAEVLEAHIAIYERALEQGVPPNVPAPQWYAERMLDFEEDAWDRRLSEHTSEELGFNAATRG